ncbi:MAG: ABC transporter ATP-binding protein/permease [Desulfobacterales bacterium]
MGDSEIPVVKRSLFSWIFGKNTKFQVLALLLITVTVFARVLPLEMQKRIVNEAIRLRDVDLLIRYCAVYFVAVVSASGLKYLITAIQVVISQRTLSDLRNELYRHIISLPLQFFRRTQPGLVVSSLVNELTLPSNFVGMAVAVPVINILTLISFAGYLFWLNAPLAALSLSIYPIVVFLIPYLQKRVNRANQKRVDITRQFSDKITESIYGIHEIHGNGAYRIEAEKHGRLVGRLYKVRLRWDLLRAAIKQSNNFFTSLGPLFVFILGGYLSLKGQLELGALVAFLSAQEKLYDPWKELIEFYQAYQDGSVSYEKTMSYFDAAPEHTLTSPGRPPLKLDGSLELERVEFQTEDGIRLLENISFSLKPGEHLALVGYSGSGKSTLALCVGQLYSYTSGHIRFGSREVSEMTKQDMISNMGFVSQTPFIFDGTMEENLLYACAARMNGQNGGQGELPSLDDMIEVLHQTGLFVDALRFGLNAVLDARADGSLVDHLIVVRRNFKKQFGEELAEYVEFFDENRYLYHSSVAENLTFGTAHQPEFAESELARNRYFIDFLKKADLHRPLLELGADLARQTVDILGNLPPEKVFFEQSPIAPEELDDVRTLLEGIRKRRLHQLSEPEKERLLQLALRFAPGRHKMVPLPQLLERLILEGRSLFRETIDRDDRAAFSFYQVSDYIESQSILNNIFFGKNKTTSQKAQDRIDQSIIQLLIEEDLLERIIKIGLQYSVGSKGDRLSGGQRQKLAIARSLLKAPVLLILDEATSALDNRSQARIQNLLETRHKGKTSLISVVHRLDIIKNFDKVAVMKAGKIIEMGRYDELMQRKGALYELKSGRA